MPPGTFSIGNRSALRHVDGDWRYMGYSLPTARSIKIYRVYRVVSPAIAALAHCLGARIRKGRRPDEPTPLHPPQALSTLPE